jgi:ABC-2 type transport system permease protein
MRHTAEYVALEVRRAVRDGGYPVFTIGMPVLLYLLFSNLGVSGADAADVRTGLMVGMAAYGGLGAALGNGSVVAEDKQRGWLRQLRITPLTPAQVVAGRLVTGLVVVLPAIAGVLLAGALVNGVVLSPGRWAAVAVLLWLGTAPFSLLGLGIGYRFEGSTANLAGLACTVLLAAAGGLWIPTDSFPHWLARLAAFTPAHGYGGLSWSAADGQLPGAGAVACVAGWLVVFGGWAVYAYRRPGNGA